MLNSFRKKEKAINLRKEGLSYREINNELDIPESTLNGWFKIFKPKELDVINKKIRQKYWINLREGHKKRSERIKKDEIIKQEIYSRDINSLTKENLFWLGLGLYWAEGGKTDRWSAKFYNSDPTINKAMMRYFREILNVPESKLRIQLVLHQNVTEKSAINYWSKILNLTKEHFFKASYSLSKASKGKRDKNRLPYGTIQIYAGGKIFCNKIRGWTLGVKNQVEQAGVVQQ